MDERSQDLVYASSCYDLEEILLGDAYMQNDVNEYAFIFSMLGNYFPWVWAMDDDVEEFNRYVGGDVGGLYLKSFYEWKSLPFSVNGLPLDDYEWERMYKHIAATNVVIDLADDFTNDLESIRNQVKGEAHFLRGVYYFLLANLYADPYDPTNASETPGVPLKLTSYMQDLKFFRTRLDTVYGHIASDLRQAAAYLDGHNDGEIYRATSDAAWTLLSRVYLYMGEWEAVVAACDSVSSTEYSIETLTAGYSEDFMRADNPEIIFAAGSLSSRNIFGNRGGYLYRVSDDLIALLDGESGYNDLRRSAFVMTRNSRNAPAKMRSLMSGGNSSEFPDTYVIRYAEVLLNKAEALAMLGREDEAVTVLEGLLRNRYEDGNFPAITERGEELVNLIRDERRKEFCFEGHRWFDLRRYAVSPKYPLKGYELVHKVFEAPSDGAGSGAQIGYCVLKLFPEGRAWTLPIPGYEVNVNPDIEENVRVDAEYVEL